MFREFRNNRTEIDRQSQRALLIVSLLSVLLVPLLFSFGSGIIRDILFG